MATATLLILGVQRFIVRSPRETLVRAAARMPYRLASTRLRALPHQPVGAITRSAQSDSSRALASTSLSGVAAELELAAYGRVGRSDAPAAAAAWLLSGKADRAIELLGALLGDTARVQISDLIERSTDAALLSDLAAAYDQRATYGRKAADRMTAAAAAARAFKLAPSSAEAAWNRAATLQSIGLTSEARDAWRRYLSIDDRSDWATEARERLAALEGEAGTAAWETSRFETAMQHGDEAAAEALAARFPVRVNALIVRQWIPRWADAVNHDQHAASAILQAIEGASRGLTATAHDSLLRDFLAAARGAPNAKEFAHAHLCFGEAQQALRMEGTLPAIAILEKAFPTLRRARSPLAAALLADLGGHYYHAGLHADALRSVDAADREIDDRPWPLTAALSAWNRGVALTSLGRIDGAAAAYVRTIELYRRAGDQTNLGMLEMLLAQNAEMAHNTDEQWAHYIEGVTLACRYGDPERVLVVLDTFARAALRAGETGFAEIVNDAVLARADKPAFDAYRCHALITRCDLAARRGNRAAAARQCSAAAALWSAIVDPSVRARLEADLELSSAAIGTTDARLENLARAVEVSEQRKDLYRLSRVLLARGRAYVEAGSPKLARADFEQALQSLEEQRQKMEAVSDRLTFFETSRATACELVRLLVDGGENDEALGVVERVRARALIDELATADATVTSLVDVLKQIEPGRALLEYWSDDRELFVWVIRDRGTTFTRHAVSRRTLDQEARSFVDGMTPGGARALYGHLLAPVESQLAGVEIVTIIADDVMSDVPFAALQAGNGGGFLIERFAVTQSSSASAFAIAHARSVRGDSILLVSNPETGGSYALLDVRRETAAAIRATRRSQIISGSAATSAAIRLAGQRFDMLHLATHALLDDASGEPALVVANGLLTASEIEKTFKVRAGGMVVLAGCSTGRGAHSMEGNLSLARAFVAAGASTVIGSLWDTADDDSDRFLGRFYEALGNGATPAAALRAAQIAFLHSESNARPQRWAAYHIFGGA